MNSRYLVFILSIIGIFFFSACFDMKGDSSSRRYIGVGDDDFCPNGTIYMVGGKRYCQLPDGTTYPENGDDDDGDDGNGNNNLPPIIDLPGGPIGPPVGPPVGPPPVSATYYLGDVGPGGGLIFLTPSCQDNTTGKYFEAALTDGWHAWQTSSALQNPVLIGAADGDIGTGQSNTTIIVNWLLANGQTSDRAALYCNDYIKNGKNDWFLPSINELNKMYLNLRNEGLGDFANSYYWSSTEAYNSHAFSRHFNSSSPYIYSNKSTAIRLRCARSFSL